MHDTENKAILESMPAVESETDGARRQLERVLQSAGFARNERLSGFLRFIVERHLESKDQELKESVIGVEVFGRDPSFNPKRDSIVRTEAARLRARLSEYYLNGGRSDPLVIELPKGSYVPVLRAIEVPTPAEASGAPKPGGFPWKLAAALACIVALIGAFVFWRFSIQTAPITIAVLPLENVGHDSESEYFSDGLTLEIIRDLSIIEGLAVRSQTSSFAFKDKPKNIREAGNQLEADYILEGSVLRADQQLRINAQLIRVRDDFAVWSGRFDRELKDVVAIQDDISLGIVNSLRLNLGRGRRQYETSVEAYDLYLRARWIQYQRWILGYDESIDLLEKAIAKDPSFAPAYSSLSTAYAVRSGQYRFDIAEQMQRMRATATEAMRLDPLSWETHYALGMASSRDSQWEQAERSFRRAMEINPNESLLPIHLAFHVLFPVGRVDEALQESRIAERLDPLSPAVHYVRAFLLMATGRHREAEGQCGKMAAELQLKDECLGWAQLGQGRANEVIQAVEHRFDQLGRRGPGHPLRAVLGCAYARAGRNRDAEELATDSSFNPLNEAHIRICLGDKDRAFEALNRGASAGPFRIGRELEAPEYAVVRDDARLKVLRNKVGLPE